MSDTQKTFAGGRERTLLIVALGAGFLLALACVFVNWRLAALVTTGVVLLWFGLKRPVWGLAALCSLLTVEGIAAERLGMTEVHLVGILAFGIWVAHLLLYRKPIRINATFGVALLFALWAGASLLWAADPQWAWPYYGTLVQLVLLFLLTINVVETESDFRLVLGALILGALATSAMSLNLFVTNLFERARTFEAQNPNQYATVVGLAMIGGLYFATQWKSFALRALSLILTLFMAFPLVLAQSRSAWMAVLGAVGVYWWHTKNRLRSLLIVLAAAGAVVFFVFSTGVVNITVIDRATELMHVQRKGTDRFDIWRVATAVFGDNPVAGVGYMQFPVVFNRYRFEGYGIRKDMTAGRDPHSVYFGVAAELGIVGLALLFFLFWTAWREEDLPAGRAAWIGQALIVYLLLFSLGGTIYRDKNFWLALALAVKSRSLAAGSTARETGSE